MKSSLNRPMKAIFMIGFMLLASLSGCTGNSEDQTVTDDTGTVNDSQNVDTYQVDSLVVAYEVRDDYPEN